MNPPSSFILHPSSLPFRKPPIAAVPLATGRAWRGGGNFRFEEKLDGVFKTFEFPIGDGGVTATLAGELMRDGRFYAFDLLAYNRERVDNLPGLERWAALDDIFKSAKISTLQRASVPLAGKANLSSRRDARQHVAEILRPATGHGGEFLEAVLARGGEGVVAKDRTAPFGVNWFKCKRMEVFYCAVTERDPLRGSVRLGLLPTTEFPAGLRTADFRLRTSDLPDGGWLPLRGGKFACVRIGSVLKVEAFGLTAQGKLREARPDADTPESWLVQF